MGKLVLTRRLGEAVLIGDNIVVRVERTGHSVRLSIEAPGDLRILRDELEGMPPPPVEPPPPPSSPLKEWLDRRVVA